MFIIKIKIISKYQHIYLKRSINYNIYLDQFYMIILNIYIIFNYFNVYKAIYPYKCCIPVSFVWSNWLKENQGRKFPLSLWQLQFIHHLIVFSIYVVTFSQLNRVSHSHIYLYIYIASNHSTKWSNALQF